MGYSSLLRFTRETTPDHLTIFHNNEAHMMAELLAGAGMSLAGEQSMEAIIFDKLRRIGVDIGQLKSVECVICQAQSVAKAFVNQYQIPSVRYARGTFGITEMLAGRGKLWSVMGNKNVFNGIGNARFFRHYLPRQLPIPPGFPLLR